MQYLNFGPVQSFLCYDDFGNADDGPSEHVIIRTGYRLVFRSSDMKVASSSIACAMSR